MLTACYGTAPEASGRAFGIVVAVIRWHGRSWRRPARTTQGRLLFVWTRRLALLVTALGLVLMHHVVGAHQHSISDASAANAPASVEAASAPSPAVEHGEAHGDHGPAHTAQNRAAVSVDQGAVVAVGSSGPAALLHHHSGGDGHDHVSSLLHMCLAALLGAAILLILLVTASWWPHDGRPTLSGLVAAGTVPRAPPTTSRLAVLQVLRL